MKQRSSMSSLSDVFRELNTLKETGLVHDYAIGGATAVLFYAEPARTYTWTEAAAAPILGATVAD
jgi:Fe2+ or Zn2+ uptake regulation protein